MEAQRYELFVQDGVFHPNSGKKSLLTDKYRKVEGFPGITNEQVAGLIERFAEQRLQRP
jgi:ribosomal protein S15P/S13E